MTNVLSRLCPRLMAPALALAFLGGSALAGAETAPAIAPDAQNEVVQMGKTLSTGGFSFQIHTIREYVDDNGQPLHIFHTIDASVRRPDRLERIAIGLERKRGCGVVAVFPGMEAIDGATVFG